MTTLMVERPTVTHSKYNTSALVKELIALEDGKALAIDVSDVKWVNFHSAVYKKCKSLGRDLHYSKTGNTVTMWL